jgi:putative phosphoribosyl transferase
MKAKQIVTINKELAIKIPVGSVWLEGTMYIPEKAKGIVIFAHGSGSSRHSSRNRRVAQMLNHHGIATLMMDLLSTEEEAVDARTGEYRFNIPLLARRLSRASNWVMEQLLTRHLKIGFFGASTGGGAALIAAAQMGNAVVAVVSRGGRPDLAGSALAKVQAPTLLLVGERDQMVIMLNKQALSQLNSDSTLEIISGATHLFEEPGALEEVAKRATLWFEEHFNQVNYGAL